MEETFLSDLEHLTNEWKDQFDTKPSLTFHWRLEGNLLYLNGRKLCPVSILLPGEFYYGVQTLRLILKTGWLDIVIDWPHRGDAYLSKVLLHIFLAKRCKTKKLR